MLLFCPTCGTLMQIEEGRECHCFTCKSCNYSYPITTLVTFKTCLLTKFKMRSRLYPKLKDLDEVLGGPSAWENAQITDETCPRCAGKQAYFMQLQTRSADEPMTIFYRCKDCTHRWKE